MSINVADLTQRWQQSWPQCPPVGHLFKVYLGERWVRFHSLPRAQRYANNETEYGIILDRHHTILHELGAVDIYLITVEYGLDDLATRTEPTQKGLHPNATRWMRAADPGDPEWDCVLYVSQLTYHPGDLDGLLRYVADDQATGVIITDTALRWLYHPYDGGADVILPSTSERDSLKVRHSEWLSARTDGL